jgi:hypothetical protein
MGMFMPFLFKGGSVVESQKPRSNSVSFLPLSFVPISIRPLRKLGLSFKKKTIENSPCHIAHHLQSILQSDL